MLERKGNMTVFLEAGEERANTNQAFLNVLGTAFREQNSTYTTYIISYTKPSY